MSKTSNDTKGRCACGKRALDSLGKPCPGHENCKPSQPNTRPWNTTPKRCPTPQYHESHTYCPWCSFTRQQEPKTLKVSRERYDAALEEICEEPDNGDGDCTHDPQWCAAPSTVRRVMQALEIEVSDDGNTP